MTQTMLNAIVKDTIITAAKVSAPILITVLVLGLIISIFQATTQIQEQTLVFIPKIVAIFVAILVFGPWMLSLMVDYTREIFSSMPNMIR